MLSAELPSFSYKSEEKPQTFRREIYPGKNDAIMKLVEVPAGLIGLVVFEFTPWALRKVGGSLVEKLRSLRQ